MCFHAPILSRNSTEVGVRLEQRFENLSAGMEKERVLERSWDSMRATLRFEVMDEDPIDGLELVLEYL